MRSPLCRLVNLLLLAAPVMAQITGAITGSVMDESGGAVPKAEVIIRNAGTSAERKLSTDSNGRFVAEALPVGSYDVSVSAAGFKKAVRLGLILGVADRLAVDVRLEVGQLTESVSVTADAPHVK